jgi:hypothetical protein
LKILVKIDASRMKQKTAREQKRLAFAVANAINDTAKEVQRKERVNLDKKFQIRRSTFMYRLIKITQFASAKKGVPFADIEIDTTKARVLLSIFEEGGDRLPIKGKNVAVPVTGGPARPSFSSVVPDAFTFQKLGFKRLALTQHGQNLVKAGRKISKNLGRLALKHGKNTDQIWVGKEHTFILPPSDKGPGGVFQRFGPKLKDIRLVYTFQHKPHLKKTLAFVDTARAEVQASFSLIFDRIYRKDFGK